jgi:hypothetical protein
MRMWMIDPQLMCDTHLLGEHVETHMLAGSLAKNRSVAGFISNNLVQLDDLSNRHDSLAVEMSNRGMNHESPLQPHSSHCGGSVDEHVSLKELGGQCPDCRELIKSGLAAYISACGDES